MRNHLIFVTILATSSPALADDVGANPNDPGKVTNISKGVKELDLGGIFLLSYAKAGDADAVTRISTLSGAGFQYFVNNNLSVGGNLLFDYDKIGDVSSSAFGGTVFASLHARLGLGAFLRPTVGIGALFGSSEVDAGAGVVAKADQSALLLRVAMPFAYFPSKRIVLQAGPEIDVSIGSVSPQGGGDSQSFTNIAGGFGVGIGYAF